MSYIAVDIFGTHLFVHKPVRRIGKNFDAWVDPITKNWITLPEGTAKIFYDNGLLEQNNVPFEKRDMNWGDNPIQVKRKK